MGLAAVVGAERSLGLNLSIHIGRVKPFIIQVPVWSHHWCHETGEGFQEEGRRGVMEWETGAHIESILPKKKLQHNQM